jgi:DNA-binding transcriptional LysR family regulator
VRPTPRGRRLALAVQSAIAAIEGALNEVEQFDPARSGLAYRLCLTDVGESHMLPKVMATLAREAPAVRLESVPLEQDEIRDALDSGVIDFAMGFLPAIRGTQRINLMHDRYVLLLRSGHPVLKRRSRGAPSLRDLGALEYVGVRSHPETLHILQELGLNAQLRLTASQLLAVPPIVEATDLAVLMPRTIARRVAREGRHAIAEPSLPHNEITVSLHWSKRFEADPAHVWMRELMIRLFGTRS